MPHATYTLVVDWNNDGDFSDSGEDISADLFAINSIVRGFSSPLARVASVGRATLTLWNLSRQYSPYLQANVLPRRKIRLDMTYDGVTVTKFRGFVDRITPSAGRWGDKQVVIECVDATALLDKGEGEVALQTVVQAPTIISPIVTAVYTPPSTNYDRGISVFPFSADRWAEASENGVGFEKVTASQKIADVCLSDWGRFFISKAGAPTFINRHTTFLNTTAALTLNDDMVSLGYTKGVGEIFNDVAVKCYPRSIGEENEVLGRISQSKPPKLEVSEAHTLTIQFRDPSNASLSIGGKDAITPVAGTDVMITADEAGEADDVTASVTIAMTAFSDRAEITLTNNTSAPAYVQELQVRGLAVRTREPVEMQVEDATSIAAYQRNRLNMNAVLVGNDSEAKRMADYLLAAWKSPRDVVTGIGLDGLTNPDHLIAIRDLELLNRVVVTEYQTGLSTYAGYIYAMQESVSVEGGHVMTFDLETAYNPGTPFRIDVSALNSGHLLIY